MDFDVSRWPQASPELFQAEDDIADRLVWSGEKFHVACGLANAAMRTAQLLACVGGKPAEEQLREWLAMITPATAEAPAEGPWPAKEGGDG